MSDTITTRDELLKSVKKSVNLPKTPFPMKANLAQNEAQSIKRWQKSNLYSSLVSTHESSDPFIFHDGPPYANGDIHVGHLLNKVLKDFVVRSQFLLGKQCKFTPGWDCHGLPIEHKVLQELTKSGKIEKIKSLAPDSQKMAIRNECAAYAKKYIKTQAKQMQSLLTIADYDAPYLTMAKQYEKGCLEVFSELLKEGLVYRKLKPVHWSIANQTALADAELEYYDKKDLSVYVQFPLQSLELLNTAFQTSLDSASLLIWTTTPWTLPSNLAVAIHKDFDYCLVNSSKGALVIAKELVEKIATLTETTLDIIATVRGESLLGLSYSHPFIERSGNTVHADYVNLEDGTGMVHIAPGHGTDDYLVGQEHGLDTYCPVLADGTFDPTVPEWLIGKSIWDANPEIAASLKKSGHLFFEYEFSHSYPHDWRSKTPVIFRSTEQWFISVDNALKSSSSSLRSLALDHIDNHIEFVPDWGQNRLRGMLESRPDWCISRQRSWGLPIPAFVSNGETLLTEASTLAIASVFEREGSDAWFKLSASELLADYDKNSDPDFPKNFDINTAEKMYDIFDVWFESGSSWHSVLEMRQEQFPADLYLEGSDQHRGWFHLSLLPSLGVRQQAPYKRLLTHGFIVDKNGMKMSKSQGNALNVSDLLKTYGADVARWWVSSISFENDIKVDTSFFDTAGDSYRKIRNTLRFLLSNLNDFDVISDIDSLITQCSDLPQDSLESYIVAKVSECDTACRQAFSQFNFKQAHQHIYNFCNDTLSSFYCSAVKDCLYCDLPDSENRRRVQLTFQLVLEVLLRLLSPLIPHTADEAYTALHPSNNDSIALKATLTLPKSINTDYWLPVLEARQQVLKVLEEEKRKGIENSLDAGLTLPKSLEPFHNNHCNLADLFGVSRVSFHDSNDINVQDLKEQPRCDRSWKRDSTVTLRENGLYLSDRDAEALGV